jgi:4-alpha-glucanotransferase
MLAADIYQHFLTTVTRKQWERIGLIRRSGVCTPLFSLYSRQSVGIGEIPDLKLLVDWCKKVKLSIIQLLPMNDTGFDFRPYDAQSTFALDPIYLSLNTLAEINTAAFKKDIDQLRSQFPAGKPRVDYGVKKAKLELLTKVFQISQSQSQSFQKFIEANRFWLEDYVLYKVIKEKQNNAGWEHWEQPLREKNPDALRQFAEENRERLQFYRWLQWQLFEQFTDVRQYARKKKVFIMGDLPFLVSRDSADVWSAQHYFKLDLSSGAPPDTFFAMGQRWGMPPYNWPAIEQKGFDYLIEKVKYAQNFYDMFRIDHVVGTFRIWTIPQSEPAETHGLNGHFDPSNEAEWEAHGRKLLSIMVENADMLPCAEDLGVVPECSYRTLWDFAIPGMEVQRWTKEWQTDCSFKAPEKYRRNAMTVLANHDMTSFYGWWAYEAGTVDEALFKRMCEQKGLDFQNLKPRLFDAVLSQHGRLRWKTEIRDANSLLQILERPHEQVGDLVEMHRGSYDEKKLFWNYVGLEGQVEESPSARLLKAALEKASQTSSIFSIQLLQDFMDFLMICGNSGLIFPGPWERIIGR